MKNIENGVLNMVKMAIGGVGKAKNGNLQVQIGVKFTDDLQLVYDWFTDKTDSIYE